MTLQHKYRPNTLDKVKGNRATIASIKSVFDREEDFPHAILLQGPKGCGKTTIARILKDLLKCEAADFSEINSSNDRGIAVARRLQKDAHYRPMYGDSRVYLLDEVHQTTKDFQNALLKPLEDCPSHAYFILCTTDPAMLLDALRSRCHIFEVQNLTRTDCLELLNEVLASEQVDYINPEMLDKVYEASEGCPRDALKILDQVIDLQTDDEVFAAIKSFNYQDTNLNEIWKSLLRKESWDRVRKRLAALDMSNPESMRRATLTHMSNQLLKQDNPDAALIFDCFKDNFYDSGKAGFVAACYQATAMLT